MRYPETKKGDVAEDFHGTKVEDPYRWLEDLDSSETANWIEDQNRVTSEYLSAIPMRDKVKERLTELWDFERFGVPFHRNGRYFFLKNNGLQNHFVLYVLDALEGEPRVLLDPNSWSEDGTVALLEAVPSEDGRYMAYSRSTAGTDWQEWKVQDIEAGEDLADDIKWVKFSSAAWTADSVGFFYSRYDEPSGDIKLEDATYFQKLFFHRVGTDQSDDVLVYKRDDQKEWGFRSIVSEDGRYLIIHVTQGTDPKNGLFYKTLDDEAGEVVEFMSDFDASYQFVGNDGPVFWLLTDLDAPLGRLIAIDVSEPDKTPRELIGEADDKLEFVTCIGDRFFAGYLKDARSVVKVFDLNGRFESEIHLPGLGTVSGFGDPDLTGPPPRRTDKEAFYIFSSFTDPGSVYRYDIASGTSELFLRSDLGVGTSELETNQIFYESKDGTRVPLFVVHKKGITLDGNNPTLLYGYGGFNIPMAPQFTTPNLLWLKSGGVFAQACLRGGGEYGEKWHQAGAKHNKQNVFDDFISAAKWLISNGYTSQSKLGIMGGSNGGLLVGACLVQEPDLFGAAIPSRGVLDMLRFHKSTIGWAWTADYGTPDDPEDFKHLYAYSPLHNVKEGIDYPPTLIVTADHDDRVVPSHSFKFAAALQAAQGGPAPVLIRVETKAGHGLGTPTSKLIEEAADVRSFLAHQLGLEIS